jgi:prophage maintenance system killer protein
MPLHYLTVQDMLWINHRVTGRVNGFRYGALEEGTFCQYAYGKSEDVVAQAVKFLTGFPKKNPFDAGNEATAFVGFVAFLRANGKEIEIQERDAADWIAGRVEEGQIAGKIMPGEESHGLPDVEEIVEGVLADFEGALSATAAAS